MKHNIFLALAVTTSLTACAGQSFFREAGDLDNGSFGNSTMNNSLLMMGRMQATTSLANRFASEVPSTITFDFNSAQITPAAAAILTQQAAWIRQFPEVRFRVYGHADQVGSNGANQALGLHRANAVVGYFAAQGISKSRLEAVASFGETRPVVATGGPAEANRRTVTEVSGFTGQDSRTMNGKYAVIVMREYVDSGIRLHPGNTPIVTQVDPTAAQ